MKTHLALASGKAGHVSRAVSLIFLLLGMAFVNDAAAVHASWHQESARYDVHLGVVPARVLRADASHKRLHGEFDRQGGSSQHVLAAIFRKSNGKRVTDAKVSAQVMEKKLFRRLEQEKPLEKMTVNEMVTYCNFFDLHWNGTYKIRVKIQEPGTLGEDQVIFVQKIRGLPK